MVNDIVRYNVVVHPIDWQARNSAEKLYSSVVRYNASDDKIDDHEINLIPLEQEKCSHGNNIETFERVKEYTKISDLFAIIGSHDKVSPQRIGLARFYQTHAKLRNVPTVIFSDNGRFVPDCQTIYGDSRLLRENDWKEFFPKEKVVAFKNKDDLASKFIEECELRMTGLIKH